MKRFFSFRRLYKPRAPEAKSKEHWSPFELEHASRPATAPGFLNNSSYEYPGAETTTGESPKIPERRSSSRNSAEEVAATVEDILASNRASRQQSRDDVSMRSRDVADIPLPFSPTSDNQSDHAPMHGEATAGLDEEEEEEARVLTLEEAQVLRDEAYIDFESEDADDYTQGPARFVLSTDGVQPCAALLMTFELSARIQKALQMQHAFEKAERMGFRERQNFMRFETRIDREIAHCRTGIAAARGVDTDREAALQQQVEMLTLLLEDVQSRRQTVHVRLETQAEELRDVQASANALIEEAYISAHLKEEREEESDNQPEELDLEYEYAEFCEKLKHAHDTDMVPAAPPLDLSRDADDEVPPPSEEEQARQGIINALWDAKETLDQARRDFDEREATRARDFQNNEEAAERGEPTTDNSPDDFDIRWVLRYRELTRSLIDAEAAYAEVKRNAFEAGVPLPSDDDEYSRMMDPGDGLGYTVSQEQEMVASAPLPKIQGWLARMPRGVEVGSPFASPSLGTEIRSEADEWEAGEVEISDSASDVAWGRDRVRIDGWKKACDPHKQE